MSTMCLEEYLAACTHAVHLVLSVNLLWFLKIYFLNNNFLKKQRWVVTSGTEVLFPIQFMCMWTELCTTLVVVLYVPLVTRSQTTGLNGLSMTGKFEQLTICGKYVWTQQHNLRTQAWVWETCSFVACHMLSCTTCTYVGRLLNPW